MKKHIWLFALLLVFSMGCSSSDDNTDDNTDNNIEPKEKIYLVKEIHRDGILESVFTHDADHQLTRKQFYNNDGTFSSESIFLYEKDTILAESYNNQGDLTIYHKYYRLNDESSRVERKSPDGTLLLYWVYQFGGNPCGYVSRESYSSDGLFQGHVSVAYTDDNCSENFSYFDENGVLQATEEVQRDGKKGYRNSTIPLAFYRVENIPNILKQEFFMPDGSLNEYSSYSVEYEYNEGNYPISQKITYANGLLVENYEYTYEVIEQ